MTHDLGHGWEAQVHDDGCMTVCNHQTNSYIELPKKSVELLRLILNRASTASRAFARAAH